MEKTRARSRVFRVMCCSSHCCLYTTRPCCCWSQQSNKRSVGEPAEGSLTLSLSSSSSSRLCAATCARSLSLHSRAPCACMRACVCVRACAWLSSCASVCVCVRVRVCGARTHGTHADLSLPPPLLAAAAAATGGSGGGWLAALKYPHIYHTHRNAKPYCT